VPEIVRRRSIDHRCSGELRPRNKNRDGYTDVEDCPPLDAARHRGTHDVCNDPDDDYDGDVDEDTVDLVVIYPDADGDGYGTGTGWWGCRVGPSGVLRDGDCDDQRPNVYPDAPDIRGDRVDNDCADDEEPCALAADLLPVRQRQDLAGGRRP